MLIGQYTREQDDGKLTYGDPGLLIVSPIEHAKDFYHFTTQDFVSIICNLITKA